MDKARVEVRCGKTSMRMFSGWKDAFYWARVKAKQYRFNLIRHPLPGFELGTPTTI